ncbi:YvrJ family protein [Bacillus sp. JJ1533]
MPFIQEVGFPVVVTFYLLHRRLKRSLIVS